MSILCHQPLPIVSIGMGYETNRVSALLLQPVYELHKQ